MGVNWGQKLDYKQIIHLLRSYMEGTQQQCPEHKQTSRNSSHWLKQWRHSYTTVVQRKNLFKLTHLAPSPLSCKIWYLLLFIPYPGLTNILPLLQTSSYLHTNIISNYLLGAINSPGGWRLLKILSQNIAEKNNCNSYKSPIIIRMKYKA